MTTITVGSNSKYSEGWESAFGKGGKKKAAPSKPAPKAKAKAKKKKK